MTMSAFQSAVVEDIEVPQVCYGENGHAQVTLGAFGDPLVALFFQLVRGAREESLHTAVENVVKHAKSSEEKKEAWSALLLLTFQTRWCRGGKGERLVFLQLFIILLEHCQEVALSLLDLIPNLGYWKDLFVLLSLLKKKKNDRYETVSRRVWDLCCEQHERDLVALEWLDVEAEGAQKAKLSNYAKYFPSENSTLDRDLDCVKIMSERLFGESPDRRKMLRKQISRMRIALGITERFMCSKEYRKINFSTVPSVCLKRNTTAFLNDTKTTTKVSESGTRFPNDDDRVEARKKFIKTLSGSKGVNGKQVFPNELVREALMSRNPIARLTLDSQWKSIREQTVAQIEERKAFLAKEAAAGNCATPADVGNVVCLSDVSGSMSGTPMEVSIAMGILCSEITHPDFRDVVLTFESQPQWHKLNSDDSFTAKVESLQRAPWGGSTDFYAALEKIGQVVEKCKLKEEEIPSLLVVSDMQFNDAGGNSEAIKNIKNYFAELGKQLYGKPFKAPTIIFWNVRATSGFPTKADEQGVVLMSGFSPALFKFVFSGELNEVAPQVDDETGKVTEVRVKPTPVEVLKKVLDDPKLDQVRQRIQKAISQSTM